MSGPRLLRELCRYTRGTWADNLYRNALVRPDAEAFVEGSERVTFAEFNARANRLVHALQALGLKKGDTIGVLAWNSIAYAVLYGAAMKGGFILSPFNPRLQTGELEYLVRYSEAPVVFADAEFVETAAELGRRVPALKHVVTVGPGAEGALTYDALLAAHSPDEPGVPIEPDDPFVIFYTSGTTGTPRGALHVQGRNVDHTRTRAIGLNVVPGDRHVMILPLFHIGGYSQFWAFFYVGGANVLLPQKTFDAATTLRALQDERATDIHIVPTHLVGMLAVPGIDDYRLDRLKRIWYAASPMPTDLLKRGMERFGPIFMQGYGQSESGPDIAFLDMAAHDVLDRPPEEQKILASCGQPCPGVHVRVVDEKMDDVPLGAVGEIVVQSGYVMVEYWRRPEDTAEAFAGGWLHTGDLAYYDERCNLYIVGRKKDMIISGGENVYPREIEEILYTHPAVAEAAVIGLPDPVWVERVHAVVALRSGSEATAEELIRFCKASLASYKVPKTVELVEALPKNPQGKILKREIKSAYEGATK